MGGFEIMLNAVKEYALCNLFLRFPKKYVLIIA